MYTSFPVCCPPYAYREPCLPVQTEKRNLGGPAQIHDKPVITTTRLELWGYYLYYVGNNGLSGFNLGPSQFQNLLFLAGYDPSNEPFTTPCGTGSCVLPYLGRVRDSEYSISPNSCLNWTIHQTCSQLDCSPDKWHQLCLASCHSSHYRCLGWLWLLEVCPNQALSDQLALSPADLISRFFSLWLLSRFLLPGLVLKMPQNGKLQ